MDAWFPLWKHCCILLFIGIDFSLVFQFCQFSGSFFIHFFLEVSPLNSILLVHLHQEIHLMSFSIGSFLGGSSFEFCILLSDGSFNLLLFILSEPFKLMFLSLLQKNIFFSWLVDILQEIDPGLFFSLPLCLSHFMLSLSFLLDKFIHQLFVSSLIALSLLIVLLESNNLSSSLSSLLLFDVLEGLFSGESLFKELLVSHFLSFLLNFPEFSLSCIMVYKLKISLSIKNELLLFGSDIRGDLLSPLILEHILLSQLLFLFNFRSLFPGIILPGENIQSLLDFLLLLFSLCFFSLYLLIMVKHPEFGINLLLEDVLFKFHLFIHELLFPFDLGTGDHEVGFFTSQIIGLHFEFPLKSMLDLLLSLLFSLILQGGESFSHFGSDLFWRFKIIHKFFFILFVLSGQKSS